MYSRGARRKNFSYQTTEYVTSFRAKKSAMQTRTYSRTTETDRIEGIETRI